LGTLLFNDVESARNSTQVGRGKGSSAASRGSTAFTFIEMANRKETSNIQKMNALFRTAIMNQTVTSGH
tara:strand:+ start:361 stop:567 length:207 start_codon:yes stop_codon:yes gene_type:complete